MQETDLRDFLLFSLVIDLAIKLFLFSKANAIVLDSVASGQLSLAHQSNYA